MKTPPDWEAPNWYMSSKVHDWKNYASEELADIWHQFDDKQKMTIASCLQDVADTEHWV